MNYPTWEEVEAVIQRPKRIDSFQGWFGRPSNSNFLYRDAQVLDELGVTIPGLLVRIAVRLGSLPELCNEKYTLYRFPESGRGLSRILQVEVYPRERRSHANPDGADIYGPHLTYGENLEIEPLEFGFDCGPKFRHEWLEFFFTKANIAYVGEDDVKGQLELRLEE